MEERKKERKESLLSWREEGRSHSPSCLSSLAAGRGVRLPSKLGIEVQGLDLTAESEPSLGLPHVRVGHSETLCHRRHWSRFQPGSTLQRESKARVRGRKEP